MLRTIAFRHLTLAIPIAVVGLAVAIAAFAAEPGRPMAFRGVMQQLGQDMQAVTGAIAMEDWAQVAELAPKIARHAEPPVEEKTRILGWLGPEATRFHGFDHEVHGAADAMGKAASKGDGPAVIASFAKVQQGCLGCHQAFRKRFAEHFDTDR